MDEYRGEPGEQTTQVSPQQQADSLRLGELCKLVASGGNWFYWIAGLSIVNTLVVLFNGSFTFVLGLGITQAVDYIISEYGRVAVLIGVPFNLIITGFYIVFGYFACRRARWAFVTGLIFYTLDTLLFLLSISDMWIGLIFHIWALYGISRGLKADTMARELEARMQQGIAG